HSLSPLIHNKTLHKLGLNGVYLPFRVRRGDLAPFLKAFERVGVRGYSVTIPHKEAAAIVAVHKTTAVAEIQAANTLVHVEDGWSAYNTDAQAAGCHVLTGVDMFVRQAALQFELFTGRAAPLEVMRGIVKRVLSPVTIPEEEG